MIATPPALRPPARGYGWAGVLSLFGVVVIVAGWRYAHAPDPTAEYESARLSLAASEAHQTSGEFVLALGQAARAGRMYAELAARFPDDADARRGAARADFRLGRAYYGYGYPAAAEPFFVQAAAGFASLRPLAGGDDLEAEYLEAVEWRANAWDKFGWGEYTGDLRKAAADGWKALAARPGAKPAWLFNHGKTLEAEADRLYAVAAAEPDRPAAVLECRSRYRATIDTYRRAWDAEPGNVEFGVRLLEASLSEVELLALVNDHAGMNQLLPPLEALAEQLLASHPTKVEVLRSHLRTRQNRARCFHLKGTRDDLRNAVALYSELAATCRERIAVYPRQTVWVHAAVEQGQQAGKVAFQLADWVAAGTDFEQAVAVWERHPDRFSVDQLGWWYLDLVAHLAVAHERRGDKPAARATVERGQRFATGRGHADAERALRDRLARAAADVGDR